jgi:hypothetical protein
MLQIHLNIILYSVDNKTHKKPKKTHKKLKKTHKKPKKPIKKPIKPKKPKSRNFEKWVFSIPVF